jgi:hypothetical protein
MKTLFDPGRVVATPAALRLCVKANVSPLTYIVRHTTGDWGELLDAGDIEANRQALIHGTRLLSAYELPTGEKLWVITEHDRSSTCVLLPEEY